VSYSLQPLDAEQAARWDDLIAPFAGRELFHRRAWLDYLAASRGVEIRLWSVVNGERSLGYFCGGIVRKGPFRILGSPLKGWGTNSMGPVVQPDTNERDLLGALDVLARQEGLAMTELEHTAFSDSGLRAFRYEPVPNWTYLVKLTPGDPDAMWRRLESTCRNRIRKAQRAGLVVEETDDLGAADEFYDQYLELMARKGLVPPYPRDTARLLVRHLVPAGLLFLLRVRDAEGRVLATGLFPHDDHTVYFWGGASRMDTRDRCPNDLLHWSLMERAAERGLTLYNMCGDGRFKRKFGGERAPVKRWHKHYWRSARWAQRGYAFYFQKRISVQGWLQGLVDGRSEQRSARTTSRSSTG
jgi:CelD/BcsL family acetyltransferase involved in cellulose biosynthesis